MHRFCISLFIFLSLAVLLSGCNKKQPRFKGIPDAALEDDESTSDGVTFSKNKTAYVDENYKFRIDLPSKKWRITRVSKFDRARPGATVAAYGSEGDYGTVIVEPVGNLDRISIRGLVFRRNMKQKAVTSHRTPKNLALRTSLVDSASRTTPLRGDSHAENTQ